MTRKKTAATTEIIEQKLVVRIPKLDLEELRLGSVEKREALRLQLQEKHQLFVPKTN